MKVGVEDAMGMQIGPNCAAIVDRRKDLGASGPELTMKRSDR